MNCFRSARAASRPNLSRVKAADNAVLFKTFTKALAQQSGLLATFMAKWSMDYPGQSGHLHQSLNAVNTGQNVFYDESDSHNMSDTMRYYVGGLQKHMKSFLAMTSPTVNSYTRLVKGAWAPTAATWGVENRTSALRVIKGNNKSQRVEFRVGSADANPYLTAAANIAAGLDGIKNKIHPGDPADKDLYDLPAEEALAIPTVAETFDVGIDTGTQVDPLYQGDPFKFTGVLDRVRITLND